MGEYSYAEIKIPQKFIKGVIAEAIYSDLGIDEAELNEATINGVFVFSDDEARFGQFETLEASLKSGSVPFDRRSSSTKEFGPCMRIFRPKSLDGRPCRDIWQAMDEDGNAYFKADALKVILRLEPKALKKRLQKRLDEVLLNKTSPLELWATDEIQPAHEPAHEASPKKRGAQKNDK